jgi:hypothetical protein
MPSDDSINALLPKGAAILQSAMSGDGLTVSHYVDGGELAPGRFRWIDCTAGDSAATQAAAIQSAIGG